MWVLRGEVTAAEATHDVLELRLVRGDRELPHLGLPVHSFARDGDLRHRRVDDAVIAKIKTGDLAFLGELLEAGRIKSVIGRTYPLEEAAGALAYLGEGHAKAKIVLTIS